MFLHARQILRRRLKAAAEKAKAEAATVEKSAEELAAEARAAAEKARAEFVAAFHRFNVTLQHLEGRAEGGAADVVAAIDVPMCAIDHALEHAGVDLEAEAEAGRQAQ